MNITRFRVSRIILSASMAALMSVAVLLFGLVTIPSAHAQTLTDLYSFTGGTDGGQPFEGVIRDTKGNFYGTTSQYGSGFGVVYEVSAAGTETVLYTFTGGADGGLPHSSLLMDATGNLYGTTFVGGSGCGSSGCGVVFKLDKAGKETVLYSFKGGTADGCDPGAPLVRDKAGNFYGTTGQCGASNFGTVFKLTKSGKETVLHNFAGPPSDGQYPYYGALLIDKQGNFYGITDSGGASGNGTLFKLSKSGTLTLLHSFAGGSSDGELPFGGPVADKNGNLYGTTDNGGSSNVGIVWKVSKKGKETVLHNFTASQSDGAHPFAGVILDAKGNLYGSTMYGGAIGVGTVYELNTKGALTLLHSFDGSDGQTPWAGLLLRDSKGTLYGTTRIGGTGGEGTLWQLTK